MIYYFCTNVVSWNVISVMSRKTQSLLTLHEVDRLCERTDRLSQEPDEKLEAWSDAVDNEMKQFREQDTASMFISSIEVIDICHKALSQDERQRSFGACQIIGIFTTSLCHITLQ